MQNLLFSGMVHPGRTVSLGFVYLDAQCTKAHAEWEREGDDKVYSKILIIFPHDLYWNLCVPWCTCRVRSGGWRRSIKQKTGYFPLWSIIQGLCLWALRTLMHKKCTCRVKRGGWQNQLFSGMIYAGKAVSLGSAYLDAHAEWEGKGWRQRIMQIWLFSGMIYAGRSVSMGSVYLDVDAHAEWEREGEYCKTGYFLAWSMLEGPCLWALCTLMHMQSKKGRKATMYAANLLFSGMVRILYAGEVWVFWLCVPWCTCRVRKGGWRRCIRQSQLCSGMIHAGRAASLGSVYLDAHA